MAAWLRKKSNQVTLAVMISLLFLIGTSGFAVDQSLSDLSTDLFKKQQAPARNPFQPGGDMRSDPASLILQGLAFGSSIKVALVSGKIVKEGDKVGNFQVATIKNNTVIFKTPGGNYPLNLNAPAQAPQNASLLLIAFQNSDLKDALRLLGVVGGFNVIMSETLGGRVSVTLENTTVDSALRSILKVNNLDYVEENSIVRVGTPDDFAAQAKYVTTHVLLKYAKAPDVVKAVLPLLSEKGSASADARSNIITVRDNQSLVNSIESLLESVDHPSRQVRIEAKILDVSRNFSRSLGIQWGFTKNSGQVQGFGVSSVGTATDGVNPLNVNFPALGASSGLGVLVGNMLNNTDLEAILTAAEDRGDAHLISQPSISTLNNVAAKIRSGTKIYVKSTSTIAVGGSAGSASGNQSGLEEIDTGVELTVTPQITPDNTIKLEIAAQESEADFSHTVDGIPSVIDNTATTTVLVNNGETTVIGGLMKIKKTNSTTGVPLASSIPVVGMFFKSKTKTKTDNELLIFITPRIINEGFADNRIDKPFDEETIKAETSVKATAAKEKTAKATFPPPVKEKKKAWKKLKKNHSHKHQRSKSDY